MVDLTSAQQPMAQPRPSTPRTPRRLPIQLQEQTDADASVSITINVPANLAADTEISVVLTPRSSRIARSLPPQITPLRFQPVAPGPPRPTTPSPSPLPSPVCQRAPRRPPVILDPSDPVYPRPPGSLHPNDPVPNIPTRSRKFYCVFRGSKIGVFWDSWSYITTISKDIGGHWRKADTYEQAVEKWNATDTSQREIFNGD